MQESCFCIGSQRQLKWNTVYIALVLCITTISKLYSLFVSIPYNIVFAEAILTILLIVNNRNELRLCRTLRVLSLLVIFTFSYSLFLVGFEKLLFVRMLKFVMYGILPCICLQYRFDSDRLRRYILNIGCLYILYLYLYAVPRISSGVLSIDVTMDYAYSALVFIYVAVFTIWTKEKWLYRVISIAELLLFGYFMLFESVNRGALLSLGVFLVMFFIMERKGTLKKTILIILVFVLLTVAIINLIPLLEWVYMITSRYGLEIAPIRKVIQQLSIAGNATSGRNVLYKEAWEIFCSNKGFPSGIGSFYQATGVEYPHNILLELGVEMGFPAVIFLLYLIVKALRFLFSYEKVDMARWLLFLFCLSIPRLMLSSTIWDNSYFWILVLVLFEPSIFHLYGNFIFTKKHCQ